MPSKAIYKCACCGGDFTARTADRARGWARYCSKACKAIKQESRTGQYAALLDRRDEDIDYEDGGWDAHKSA